MIVCMMLRTVCVYCVFYRICRVILASLVSSYVIVFDIIISACLLQPMQNICWRSQAVGEREDIGTQ